MRTISAGALTAFDEGRYMVRSLLSAYPDGVAPLHIWDGRGDITVNATTYSGSAGRFTVALAPSSGDLAPRPTDITLSGLDSDVVAMIMSTVWHQRPIVLQRVVFLLPALTVASVIPEFSGYMDTAQQTEALGGLSTIKFRCETAARELTRSGARTRSDADQRTRDATDDFFASSIAAMNTAIDWGRAPEKPPKAAGLAGLIDKIF